MNFDFTSPHAFLQLKPAVDATTDSRHARAERVLNGSLTIIDLADVVTGGLERAFDKAAANGREHAWETFIEQARTLAPSLGAGEVKWLQRALITPASSLRATAALARALGVIAEARPDYRDLCAAAFERLAKHPSPEIRSIVLEWVLELGTEIAHRIASQLASDGHPAVQQAAKAVLAAR
jgi:hypothetical protein